MSDKHQTSVLALIVASVVVAFVAGMTALWWWSHFVSRRNGSGSPLETTTPSGMSSEFSVPATQPPSKTAIPNSSPARFASTAGLDYSTLEQLLISQKFGASEVETGQLIKTLKANGYPCTDLKTVDRLWNTHSDGRFGLGIQLEIWRSVGGDINQFSTKVGWSVPGRSFAHGDLQFSLDAPRGHLPWLQAVKHASFLPQVNRCL